MEGWREGKEGQRDSTGGEGGEEREEDNAGKGKKEVALQ